LHHYHQRPGHCPEDRDVLRSRGLRTAYHVQQNKPTALCDRQRIL